MKPEQSTPKQQEKFKMGKLEYSGLMTPWMRPCIGAAILALALTPALYVILRYA